MATEFGGLHFWVRDMEASLAFYRLVGLPIADDAQGEFVNITLPGGRDFAFGTYGLTRQYDAGFAAPSSGGKSAVALQFNVESRAAVDEMFERLTGAGYAGHLAPFDAFWRARYCEVMDPDGNVVGFHSPQDRVL